MSRPSPLAAASSSSSPPEQEDTEKTATVEQPINLAMTTISLCACTFVGAYLMISMFPYSGYMVMHLVEGTTQDTVGGYAGILSGTFMAGNVVTAYATGQLADTYGRKFVLIVSLLLSGTFAVMFGSAQSFHAAVLCRFLSGMCGSIVGVVRTSAFEVSPQNGKHTMGLILGTRPLALLISPAIGGFLAEPLNRYPSWGENNAWVRAVLEKCPFLLPNLVGAVGCTIVACMVAFMVPETVPLRQRRSIAGIPQDVLTKLKSLFRGGSQQERLPILQEAPETAPSDKAAEENSIGAWAVWNNNDVRPFIIVQWCYGFLLMACSEAFPLFCMSVSGGPGLQEASIGTIMSGAGLLCALFQYMVYGVAVELLGLYNTMFLGSLGGLQTTLLIPLSLLLPRDSPKTLVWLSVVNGMYRVLASLFTVTNAIVMNESVPRHLRATMNGFAGTGGSLARAFAPFFAGTLSTFAYGSLGPGGGKYGSLLVYGAISALGLCVSWQLWTVTRAKIARENGGNAGTITTH